LCHSYVLYCSSNKVNEKYRTAMNAKRKNGIILQQSIWKGTQPLKKSVLNLEIIEPHFIADNGTKGGLFKVAFRTFKA
jgi:hypothetical protein